MKRPLAWLCIAFVIVLAAVHRFGDSPGESPPSLALDYVLELADENNQITLRGTVAECNAVSEGIRLSIDHISIQTENVSGKSLRSDLKITFTTEENLMPGDMVRVKGEIKEFEPATNPGQFDAREWYFGQNVICTLRQPEILDISRGGISLNRVLYMVRSRLRESYTEILGEKAARTISAITLGEKSYLEQEWKNVYQEGGIAHILAISGLHITLIGMALYRLLRKFGAGFLASAISGGTIVLLYTLMTGHGISAVRAAVMFGMWLGSQVCGRKQDMVTATAVAALVLVLADGRNVSQASFLLSFGAILSLGIVLPRLEEAFAAGRALPRGILAGFAVWLGTLPCTLYFYYQTAPWSLLVNLAVIPLMSGLMTAGLVSAILGIFWIPLGIFLAAPVSYILDFFEWLCALERKLPACVWVTGRPAVWRIVCYYGILAAAVLFFGKDRPIKRSARLNTGRQGRKAAARKDMTGGKAAVRERLTRGKIRSCAAWIACAAVCVFLMRGKSPENLRIVCMDVGQGDGCLLQLPAGVNCLIDGGSSSKRGLWDNILSQTVKFYGVRTLDYIFLSHADQDHISGIEELLEEYEPGFAGRNCHGVSVKYLVLPPAADTEDFQVLKTLAREKGIVVLRMEAGDLISGGEGWSIRCLAPEEGTLVGDRNQDSMVLRLEYGRFSMLFTGDLEEEAEQRLARLGPKLCSDVLKVGHHGSAKASCEAFLSQVLAKLAVISCGKNNVYGHPAPDTVKRLENAGCQILETAKNGAVILETDGEKYKIQVGWDSENDVKE